MRRGAVSLVLAALLLGACSSSGEEAEPAQSGTDTRSAKTTTDESAALEEAVRGAIREDHQLSIDALRTNRVPREPAATAGPALARLRQSVAQRRRRGIRIRMISERFRILEIRLDPSFTKAAAVVSDTQRVQPYRRDQRLGRSVTLKERAQLELRRIGDQPRFVVWKVVLAR
jgi:hypothetical protein